MPKYYLKIPIHELHADMIKSAENGGLQEAKDETGAVIISETMLRARSTQNCRVLAFFPRRAHVEGKKPLPRAIWSFCSSGAFYVHMNFC